VGIDPGLAATGIGIVQGCGMQVAGHAYGSIRTASKAQLPVRLEQIHTRTCALLRAEAPDLVVIEEAFSLERYPKSGLTLGKVIGVLLLAAQHCALPVAHVAVREAKHILTGNGNASKRQLEAAVRHLLKLDAPIRPDHAADALGLALVGLYRYAHLRPEVKPAREAMPRPASGRGAAPRRRP